MNSDLIHKIYQTVTDDRVLPDIMRDFEALVGGYSSALMVASKDQYWMHQTNMDPEITELYNDHYSDKDVWIQRAETQKLSGVTTGLMGLADHSEFDPAYFNDILQASDCQDCLSTFLFGSARETMGFFSIYRSLSRDPFQRADVELMETYAGHLKHAFGLRSEFKSLSADVVKLQDALSQINGPVMFLGEGGVLAWANPQADAELARQSVIKIQSGRLCAVNSHFAANLAAAIRSVFQTKTAATLPICVGDDGTPCMMYLTLLSADVSETASEFTTMRPNSTMIMAKLKTPPEVSAQSKAALQSHYGLTGRQVDVALRLADGDTIADIAAGELLSVGTVRNHVKAIFEKTGTSRQAELVKLILTL